MIGAGECVVTGVTSGLGAYTAKTLADEGWRVTGIGRKSPGHADIPGEIAYLQADLANTADLVALPGRIGACPHLFVHCAVTYPNALAGKVSAIEEVFRVNTFAPYHLTLELLALKPAAQFASFIVVNSEAMFNADEKSGVYGASKAALRVLTSAIAHACRGRNGSVSTLLLGPLANEQKMRELEAIAFRKSVSRQELTRLFLRKSNPNIVLDDLITFPSCLTCIRCIYELGIAANGMMCRLDGGAGGSLV
jgi:NAD(P)-dependent dehydrogenase (short-subunit alcohol dehydrogenase family)